MHIKVTGNTGTLSDELRRLADEVEREGNALLQVQSDTAHGRVDLEFDTDIGMTDDAPFFIEVNDR